MERFLTQLYQEEMSKQAAADLQEALTEQPIEALEAYLGLRKQAVAGPTTPVLPTHKPEKALDAKSRAVEVFAAKSRGEAPPTLEQSAEASHTNNEGEGKTAMIWADQMGRKLAAAVCKSGGFYDKMKENVGKQHDWMASQGLALPRKVKAGQGDAAGMGEQGAQGMTALGGLGDPGVGEDKTAIACVKAKIACVALRASRGAPPHMRKIAAAVAGQKIAAAQEYSRGGGLPGGISGLAEAAPPTDVEGGAFRARQGQKESYLRQMLGGAAAGATPGVFGGLGLELAHRSSGEGPGAKNFALPLAALTLGGAGLGAGIGALRAHHARKEHAAMQAAAAGEETPKMAPHLESQQRKEDVLRQAVLHGLGGAGLGAGVGASGGLAGRMFRAGAMGANDPREALTRMLSNGEPLLGGRGALIGAGLGAGLGALHGVHSAHQAQKRRMALTEE